jgi:hypothetical protein
VADTVVAAVAAIAEEMAAVAAITKIKAAVAETIATGATAAVAEAIATGAIAREVLIIESLKYIHVKKAVCQLAHGFFNLFAF